jgi:hypothetical protein
LFLFALLLDGAMAGTCTCCRGYNCHATLQG